MYKFRIILTLLCFNIISLSAQIPVWDWVKKGGGKLYDNGTSVCTDLAGNIYVCGVFSDTATFGNTTLIATGTSSGFIGKYNTTGKLIWLSKTGGLKSGIPTQLSADNLGNIYLSGSFSDTVSIFDSTFIAQSSNDVFIASLDTSGNFRWALHAGNTAGNYVYGSSTDKNGNYFITGIYKDSLSIADTVIYSQTTNYDMYVIKLGADGIRKWISRAGGPGSANIFPAGMATGTDGNSYVCGNFSGTALTGMPSWGPHTLDGSYNDFISKIDSSGNWIYATNIGYNPHWNMADIAVDDSGNCFTIGSFGYSNLPIIINNQFTLNAYGIGTDFYVVKWNTLGNAVWARHGGCNNNFDKGISIAVSKQGEIFATGISGSSAQFGSHIVSGFGKNDIVVVKYDQMGNEEWAICSGGTELDEPSDICTDTSGNIYVTGFYMKQAFFGNYSVTGGGTNGNAFLSKISTPTITGYTDNQLSYSTQLTIYPNPSTNIINCHFEEKIYDGILIIRNIDGRIVRKFPIDFNGNDFKIDISSLEQGLYNLNFSNSYVSLSRNFIKL